MGHSRTRRRTIQQPDLFERPPSRPRWPDLPADTRTRVTALLARLLGARHRPPATPRAEVDDE